MICFGVTAFESRPQIQMPMSVSKSNPQMDLVRFKTPTRYLANGTKLARAAGSFFSIGAQGGEDPTAVRTPVPVERRRARPAILPASARLPPGPTPPSPPRYLPAAPPRAAPPAGSSRPAPPPAATRRPGSAARLGPARSSAAGDGGRTRSPRPWRRKFRWLPSGRGPPDPLAPAPPPAPKLCPRRESPAAGRRRLPARNGRAVAGGRTRTMLRWRSAMRRCGGERVGTARHGAARRGTGRGRCPCLFWLRCCSEWACGSLDIFIFRCIYRYIDIYIHGGGVCCLRRSG